MTYRPNGYTAEDQESDRSFLVGAHYGRTTERVKLAQEFDDALCDALAAARQGKYDGLDVEAHLESLIQRIREYGKETPSG